jgi:RHS repeat-associated protein
MILHKFTYDPSGNLRLDSAKGYDYRYSYFNHLSRIIIPMGQWLDNLIYGYGPDGERVYKNLIYHYSSACEEPIDPDNPYDDAVIRGSLETDARSVEEADSSGDIGLRDDEECIFTDSAVTRYYNVMGKSMMESDGRWISRKKYIYAGEDKIAVVDRTGNQYYYLKDHLGSTRVLVRQDGVVFGKYYEYKAYGETVREEVNWNQSYKFTGKPLDMERGLNLYYFGARYYNPALGRWIAVDPMHGLKKQ